jgi:predicted enzyme related to lactoylglutathione lyase
MRRVVVMSRLLIQPRTAALMTKEAGRVIMEMMDAKLWVSLASAVGALLCQGGALAAGDGAANAPAAAGHVTGVGGVFFKSKDPKALAAWYRDVMGIRIEDWGGALLRYDAPGHPPAVVWSAFPAATDDMAPSTREFMVNFAVDDLEAFSARLAAKGVVVHSQAADPNGRFAWILDPDGTKIELWQPTHP